jgi:hypothetical protein
VLAWNTVVSSLLGEVDGLSSPTASVVASSPNENVDPSSDNGRVVACSLFSGMLVLCIRFQKKLSICADLFTAEDLLREINVRGSILGISLSLWLNHQASWLALG